MRKRPPIDYSFSGSGYGQASFHYTVQVQTQYTAVQAFVYMAASTMKLKFISTHWPSSQYHIYLTPETFSCVLYNYTTLVYTMVCITELLLKHTLQFATYTICVKIRGGNMILTTAQWPHTIVLISALWLCTYIMKLDMHYKVDFIYGTFRGLLLTGIFSITSHLVCSFNWALCPFLHLLATVV